VWAIKLQYQCEAAAYKIQLCNGGVYQSLSTVQTFTEAKSSVLELTVLGPYRVRR